MLRWALIAMILLAAAVGLTIGTLNPQTVTIDLFVWRLDTRLGAALVGLFSIGVVGGVLLGSLIGPLRRLSGRRTSGGVTSLEHD